MLLFILFIFLEDAFWLLSRTLFMIWADDKWSRPDRSVAFTGILRDSATDSLRYLFSIDESCCYAFMISFPYFLSTLLFFSFNLSKTFISPTSFCFLVTGTDAGVLFIFVLYIAYLRIFRPFIGFFLCSWLMDLVDFAPSAVYLLGLFNFYPDFFNASRSDFYFKLEIDSRDTSVLVRV